MLVIFLVLIYQSSVNKLIVSLYFAFKKTNENKINEFVFCFERGIYNIDENSFEL